MKKFLLKLLMGASLTTSLFIFQACYGTPVEEYEIPRNLTQLESLEGNQPQEAIDGQAAEETEESEETAVPAS